MFNEYVDYMTPTVNKKPAKVIYRKTVDGKIEILRFENVMTYKEIVGKFGAEVARIYDSEKQLFRLETDYIFFRQGPDLRKGIISKELFNERIHYMKRCGKRLSEIRKQVALEEYTKEHVITI